MEGIPGHFPDINNDQGAIGAPEILPLSCKKWDILQRSLENKH